MSQNEELLLDCVYRHAKERPDALYMTQPLGDGRIDQYSWARALEEAKRMAAHLRSLDLPDNSRIAIMSKNCAHFMLADLAIWMAGHCSVALYPTLNAETVHYILEHSESKLLFVGKLDIWDELKPGVPDDLPCIAFPLSPPTDYPSWDDVIKKHEPIADEPTRGADDMALIMYTSGSTGQPKGVMHSFGAITTGARGISRVLSTTKEDRVLSYLPLAHAIERWLVECQSFIIGFQIFFAETLDTFVEDLKRARPTLFASVPRLWLKFQLGVLKKMPPKKLDMYMKIPVLSGIVKKKILNNLGLDHVRFAGSGSAPIPAELIAWYRRLGLELIEGYGMSENFAYSHMSIPGKTRVGYVGNAYPEVEHRISEEGEIQVKSPSNMMGYYKEPELTSESFTDDGFLKTGDRGLIDEEGRLKITGRMKELFKTSKGKYVAPAPIENMLNADNHIELSCVAGNGYPQAYAVIQLAEDLLPSVTQPSGREAIDRAMEALLKKINEAVVAHERLQFIAVAKDRWDVQNGLLTPSLKIRRAAIEKAYAPHTDAWYKMGQRVIWED